MSLLRRIPCTIQAAVDAVLRRVLSFGTADRLLDQWLVQDVIDDHAPPANLAWLCRLMAWPLGRCRFTSDSLLVVIHPTRGFVWTASGFLLPMNFSGPPPQKRQHVFATTTGPGILEHRPNVLVQALFFEQFFQSIKARALVSALDRPAFLACVQGLPDGVSLLVPENLPLGGHERLQLCTRMQDLGHSAGDMLSVPGLRGPQNTREMNVFVCLRHKNQVALLYSADGLLIARLQSAAGWSDVLHLHHSGVIQGLLPVGVLLLRGA